VGLELGSNAVVIEPRQLCDDLAAEIDAMRNRYVTC